MSYGIDNSDKDRRTLFCGNLDAKVDEELLYELFLQAGPLESVSIPRDRHGGYAGYAFITFKHECSVPYAMELFEDTTLYGKLPTLRQRRGANHQRSQSAPVNFGQNNMGYSHYNPSYAFNPSNQMDFDSLLQMSKNMRNNQSSNDGAGPASSGMPLLPGGPSMEMPPPMGVPSMGMPPLMGGYFNGRGMPMGREPARIMQPPPPPGEEEYYPTWNEHDDRTRQSDSLSKSSLQGNWSARNSSHMLPSDDRKYDRRTRREIDHRNRDGDWHSRNRGRNFDHRENSSEDRHRHGERDYYRRERGDHGGSRGERFRSRSNDVRDRRERFYD